MIDYILIAKALEKYQKLGYTLIEVPWIVSEEAINVTLPYGKKPFSLKDQYLVGSAEQSFLQLMINGQMPEGKYVATTPCFRDDLQDKYHQLYFFKVELINYSYGSAFDNAELSKVLFDAYSVLSSLCENNIEVVKTSEGFDLNINGIEIGSYGIRYYKNFSWIYGTGLAEPRFSRLNDK